jgi:hypothetical protein
MTIEISTLPDERKFVQYIAARNAPRDVMAYGVHPNNHKALQLYDQLTALLAPGGELEDMAVYHTNTISTVLTFVQTMQACMTAINGTMHIVNLLAQATGQDEIFAIEAEEIDVPAYLDMLDDAIATLQTTKATTQAAAQMLGGG